IVACYGISQCVPRDGVARCTARGVVEQYDPTHAPLASCVDLGEEARVTRDERGDSCAVDQRADTRVEVVRIQADDDAARGERREMQAFPVRCVGRNDADALTRREA